MLLSVVPPNHMQQNDVKPPHDYPIYPKPTPSRYSPPPSPRNLPPFSEDLRMNNSHRGLPPLPAGLPGSLNLPPPERGHSTVPPLGHLPAPPSQWAGQDESMRSWLHAKAEEDRRKQEEEKTRQEGLRLDQRRIEQDMLRESLQGGIPPPMVPLIFAGIGGGNLPAHTLEWAQQYLASLTIQNQQQQQQIQAQQHQLHQQQIQQQQQQQQQMSPDMHRDRMIQSNPYAGHQPLQAPLPLAQALPTAQSTQSRSSISGPTPATPSALSRLNTTDFVPNALASQTSRQPLHHPPQQAQTPAAEQPSGPGLFFHHWTPPNPSSSSAGNQPPTPSGKSTHGSPFSQHAGSHLRSEYQNSPKKRKTASGHAVPVPPTSQPSDPSQPMSSRSSREREMSPGHRNRATRHSRQNSDASSREQEVSGRNMARPSSRQQRRDELSGGAGPSPRRKLTGSSPSGSSEDSNPVRYEGDKSETR
ncbi:uncharacterized protein Z519_05128 [Cladophialophora bantiana CBS 173.52]|uniref:Uncharacterized protein n=1 Tax=Cladophialophora bantiana (strain ATCC 10958 / CBS 173.52 / CDC B-1940 / NIH 8579) TaxID=1442370 RepID=A0A0D2HKJ9_CLAB1|nr:uncharacterized protein Z519_05128 [Cladophialophora bantiana CBS 173.52]KIW93813.1 hypothetical protein Z519_05128 [Cladophialophora bantiana CBS 173.52]